MNLAQGISLCSYLLLMDVLTFFLTTVGSLDSSMNLANDIFYIGILVDSFCNVLIL